MYNLCKSYLEVVTYTKCSFDVISKDAISLILRYLNLKDRCTFLRTSRRFYFWGRTNELLFFETRINRKLGCDVQRQATAEFLSNSLIFDANVYPVRIGNRTAYIYYESDIPQLSLIVVKNQKDCMYRKIRYRTLEKKHMIAIYRKSTVGDDDLTEKCLELFNQFNIKLHYNSYPYRYPLGKTELEMQRITSRIHSLRSILYYSNKYGYETEPWVDFKESCMNKHWKHNREKYEM